MSAVKAVAQCPYCTYSTTVLDLPPVTQEQVDRIAAGLLALHVECHCEEVPDLG